MSKYIILYRIKDKYNGCRYVELNSDGTICLDCSGKPIISNACCVTRINENFEDVETWLTEDVFSRMKNTDGNDTFSDVVDMIANGEHEEFESYVRESEIEKMYDEYGLDEEDVENVLDNYNNDYFDMSIISYVWDDAYDVTENYIDECCNIESWLTNYIDYQKNNDASFEIELVISNKKDAYAIERANQNNIKAVVIDKKELGIKQKEFEQKIIEQLEENKIDLIVLAGFMCILTENFTSKYPRRIINVHPSLIPEFCGKGFYGIKVHEEVLKAGVKVTGATVHFVNEIPDGGEIIIQKKVEVKENDTPEMLQRRVMEEAEWIILPESLNKISSELVKERGQK